jgi:hypothetical protein
LEDRWHDHRVQKVPQNKSLKEQQPSLLFNNLIARDITMRSQVFLLILILVDCVSGRRGAHFWDEFPHGWGLDLPVDPMSEAKAGKMIKEVKRGKVVSCAAKRWMICVCADEVPMSDGRYLGVVTGFHHRIFRHFALNHLLAFQSTVKKTKKPPLMQPGWFLDGPERHAKFLDIEETLVESFE